MTGGKPPGGGPPLPFLDGSAWEPAAGGVKARGRLAADHPIYAGHFPGRPILPAIGQLALLEAALSLGLGARQALTGIPILKLRRTLLPGQEVEIEIGTEEESGTRRFALRSEGAPVAQGSLRAGPRPPSPPPPTESVEESVPSILNPALALLPHGPPACLLSGIESTGEEEIACTGRVPPAHALVREGWAPGYLGLEAGAQAAGLLEAVRFREEGGTPSVGYVVGMRDVTIAAVPLPAGCPFRVVARRSGGAGSLAVYEVAASGPAGPFAQGILSAFLPGPAAEGERPA